MTGFETIGNATLIVHDGTPLLATDPWIEGPAYFGSWGLSHEIPAEQMAHVLACPYIWVSHGHPDHLSADSLLKLSGKKFLLPDHAGRRIYEDFATRGFDVRILPDREWVRLSDRVKVMSIADYNQDAVLLVDVDGCLIVNLNDCNALASERFIRKIVKGYKTSFLLRIFGFGDAEMINFRAEDGTPRLPEGRRRRPLGATVKGFAEMFGVTHVVPFSSFHRYQRSDSDWANAYRIDLKDFADGFDSASVKLLPAFIRYDCGTGTWTEIHPKEASGPLLEPQVFGDNWTERLDQDERRRLNAYFKSMTALAPEVEYVRFIVGGEEHVVRIAGGTGPTGRYTGRGVTFEVPRHSLMTAVDYEVFDDLLIGNFMKTTLHGRWGSSGLYPHFSPYVGKYADNGRAKTPDQLAEYFRAYRARAPLEFLLHRLQQHGIQQVRYWVNPNSPLFEKVKKAYFFFKT